jgi:hypothetical protein
MKQHYAERDAKSLEPHLYNHMLAMTAEGLHSKAAIACELAWRDAKIEQLTNALRMIQCACIMPRPGVVGAVMEIARDALAGKEGKEDV